MRTIYLRAALVGLLVVGISQAAFAQSNWADELSAIEIGGVVGFSQPEKTGCIAVWVPVPENLALNGLRWYNNDDATAFPEVSVQSGTVEYPVALANAFPVAEGVFGETLGWSEVSFSEPIASSTDGLYVIFKLPQGHSVVSEGEGGGPAMGYTPSEFGFPGWMSADGADWVKLHSDFGFAVSPVFVDRASGMYVKSAIRRAGDGSDNAGQSGVTFRTELRRAYPNPFNPQTTISFSLKSDGPVSLAVYNVRGELVRNLVAQRMVAGPHEVIWNGRDQSDASVASGVYFARLVAGQIAMTQRLVLVQ